MWRMHELPLHPSHRGSGRLPRHPSAHTPVVLGASYPLNLPLSTAMMHCTLPQIFLPGALLKPPALHCTEPLLRLP